MCRGSLGRLTSKTSSPPRKFGSLRPIGKISRLTSIMPFSTRTLCDRVPSGTLICRKLARLGRIADVDDARSVRRRDMADIGDPIAHDDLAAAEAIEVADDPDPLADAAHKPLSYRAFLRKFLYARPRCGQPIAYAQQLWSGVRRRACRSPRFGMSFAGLTGKRRDCARELRSS